MAFLTVKNVALVGISACVPKQIQENKDFSAFSSKEEAERFMLSTGIQRRRIAEKSVTTSDLCFEAAEKLILDLNWNKKDIDCLIFVSQTPDYIVPATSCILQNKLGLSEECYTLDISLGCSGWIYGLSVISNLMSTGSFKKGLLLSGDTLSKINSEKDKSTYPLFADAGTATALEYKINAPNMNFIFSTDGSGYQAIIVPDGGNRNRVTPQSFDLEKIEDGIIRSKLHTVLNGMDVFAFCISKAPESVTKLLEHFSIDRDSIDYYLFHQANLFMNEKIRKKLKLPEEKVPYSLKDFGNTSSATIPLTMLTQLSNSLKNQDLKLIGCGFGVGLSWGSVFFETNKIICSSLIEI
jgi:3-oxoacyl-[acyl-carrier-protein] synthase-3